MLFFVQVWQLLMSPRVTDVSPACPPPYHRHVAVVSEGPARIASNFHEASEWLDGENLEMAHAFFMATPQNRYFETVPPDKWAARLSGVGFPEEYAEMCCMVELRGQTVVSYWVRKEKEE